MCEVRDLTGSALPKKVNAFLKFAFEAFFKSEISRWE